MNRSAPGFQFSRDHSFDVWLLLLVAVAGAFHLLTLRSGHGWGDDFAQYIMHARNLAEGRDYRELGVIRNPFTIIGPDAYPPVTPLLLAPVWYFLGLNLTAMKIVMVASLCLALLVTGKAFSTYLSPLRTLSLTGVFAFSPAVWEMKDAIQSEYFYILLSYTALFLIDRHYLQAVQSRRLMYALLIGVTMYLTWATREIGIILLPALVMSEVLVTRRISRYLFIAISVFAVLAVMQTRLLEPGPEHLVADETSRVLDGLAMARGVQEGSHVSLMRLDLEHLGRQAVRYSEAAKDFWSRQHVLGWVVFITGGLLSVAGFLYRLARGVRVWEIYTAGYIAVLLMFGGFQGLRYIIPLMPLYLYYLFSGLQWIESVAGKRLAGAMLVALLGVIAVLYLQEYSERDFGHVRGGIDDPDAEELLDYLRASTAPDALIACSKPRALTLLTGRRAITHSNSFNPSLMFGFLDAIRPDYVLLGEFATDREMLAPAILQRPEFFEVVFRNGTFVLYRYLAQIPQPGRNVP